MPIGTPDPLDDLLNSFGPPPSQTQTQPQASPAADPIDELLNSFARPTPEQYISAADPRKVAEYQKVAETLSRTPPLGIGEHATAFKIPEQDQSLFLAIAEQQFKQDQTMKQAGFGARLATSAIQGAVDFGMPLAKMTGAVPSLDPVQERFKQDLMGLRESIDPTIRTDGGPAILEAVAPIVGAARNIPGASQYIDQANAKLSGGVQQTARMAVPMAMSIGAGKATGGAAGLALGAAKATKLGQAAVAGARALGTSGSFLPQTADQTYTALIGEGVDAEQAALITSVSAPIEAAIESALPDPFEGYGAAFKGSARQVATNLLKKYTGNFTQELREEMLQALVNETAMEVGRQMDTAIPDKGIGGILLRGVTELRDAALPVALMVAPGAAVGGASTARASAERASRLGSLKEFRAAESTNTLTDEEVAYLQNSFPDEVAAFASAAAPSRSAFDRSGMPKPLKELGILPQFDSVRGRQAIWERLRQPVESVDSAPPETQRNATVTQQEVQNPPVIQPNPPEFDATTTQRNATQLPPFDAEVVEEATVEAPPVEAVPPVRSNAEIIAEYQSAVRAARRAGKTPPAASEEYKAALLGQMKAVGKADEDVPPPVAQPSAAPPQDFTGWTEVAPGQSLPPGVKVRMDVSTGKSYWQPPVVQPVAPPVSNAEVVEPAVVTPTVEAPPVVSAAAPEAAKKPVTYTTSRGSTYVVHEDGTTSRERAGDLTHTPGPQERSQRTVYLLPDSRPEDQLGFVSATSPFKWQVLLNPESKTLMVRILDGKDAGKFIKGTNFKYSETPQVGYYPFELWSGGSSAHIGTPIVSVSEAPVPAETLPAPPVVNKGRKKASVEIETLSGRKIAAPPQIRLKSNRTATADLKRQHQWLLTESRAEALHRGDDFNLTQFMGERADNLPPASVDAMNEYLFGETNPKWGETGERIPTGVELSKPPAVPQPFTKPLLNKGKQPSQQPAEVPAVVETNEPAVSAPATEAARPADSEPLRRLEQDVQRYDSYAKKYEGGTGIAAGAEGVDYRWKSEALMSMAADIRKGIPPAVAAESAKREARSWIEKHNARRPKDINWKRWDGAVDSAIETGLRYFTTSPAPAVPRKPPAKVGTRGQYAIPGMEQEAAEIAAREERESSMRVRAEQVSEGTAADPRETSRWLLAIQGAIKAKIESGAENFERDDVLVQDDVSAAKPVIPRTGSYRTDKNREDTLDERVADFFDEEVESHMKDRKEYGGWKVGDVVVVEKYRGNIRVEEQRPIESFSWDDGQVYANVDGDSITPSDLKKPSPVDEEVEAVEVEQVPTAEAEATPPAAPTPVVGAAKLHPFAAEQFRDYLPVMLLQVNKEVTPRKKLMAAMNVMHGLNPDAIKALAEELKKVEPEAYQYAVDSGKGVVPIGLIDVFTGPLGAWDRPRSVQSDAVPYWNAESDRLGKALEDAESASNKAYAALENAAKRYGPAHDKRQKAYDKARKVASDARDAYEPARDKWYVGQMEDAAEQTTNVPMAIAARNYLLNKDAEGSSVARHNSRVEQEAASENMRKALDELMPQAKSQEIDFAGKLSERDEQQAQDLAIADATAFLMGSPLMATNPAERLAMGLRRERMHFVRRNAVKEIEALQMKGDGAIFTAKVEKAYGADEIDRAVAEAKERKTSYDSGQRALKQQEAMDKEARKEELAAFNASLLPDFSTLTLTPARFLPDGAIPAEDENVITNGKILLLKDKLPESVVKAAASRKPQTSRYSEGNKLRKSSTDAVLASAGGKDAQPASLLAVIPPQTIRDKKGNEEQTDPSAVFEAEDGSLHEFNANYIGFLFKHGAIDRVTLSKPGQHTFAALWKGKSKVGVLGSFESAADDIDVPATKARFAQSPKPQVNKGRKTKPDSNAAQEPPKPVAASDANLQKAIGIAKELGRLSLRNLKNHMGPSVTMSEVRRLMSDLEKAGVLSAETRDQSGELDENGDWHDYIGGNEPATPEPPKPKKRSERKAEEAAAAKKVLDEKMRNLIDPTEPSMGLNPKKIAQAVDAAIAAMEYGYIKFDELVSAAVESLGEMAVRDLAPYLEEAARIAGFDDVTTVDEVLGKMTPEKVEQSVEQSIQPSSDDLTSIKKAVVNEMRAQVGLPEMEGSTPQTVEEWAEQARATLAADSQAAVRLVNELAVSPRAIDQHDAMLLQFHYRGLANKLKPQVDAYFDAVDSKDSTRIAMAAREVENARQPMTEFEEIIHPMKESWGRTGVALQQLLRRDFSLEAILRRGREKNHGKPLTVEQTAELTAMAKQLEEMQAELDKKQQRAEELERELASKEQHQQVVDQAKSKGVVKKTVRRQKAEERVASAIDALRKKLVGRAGAGVPVDVLPEAIEAAKAYVDLGVVRFGEFIAHIKQQLGTVDTQVFRKAWDQVTADNPPAGLDMMTQAELSRDARRIQKLLVMGGMTDRDQVIDAVHKIMQEELPEFTRRDTMDALSRYGQFQQQSSEPIAKALRDMNAEILKLSQIDQQEIALKRVEELRAQGKSDEEIGNTLQRENLLVASTGLVRDNPTDTVRNLTKIYNENKKSIPASSEDRAGLLQTSLSSIERSLLNRIRDLEWELTHGELIVSTPRQRPTNERIQQLEAERDALLKAHREMFPPKSKQMTQEQRLAAALSTSEKAIQRLEQQLEKQDFDTNPRTKLSSPELDDSRARLAQLRAQRKALQALELSEWEGEGGGTGKLKPRSKEEVARRVYEASLRKRIADYHATLAAGDFSPKPKKQPRVLSDSELKLKREMEDVRHKVLEKFAEYHLANLTGIAWGADKLKEAAHLSRALMTSFDLSALMRQGGLAAFGHPVLAKRALAETIADIARTFDKSKAFNRGEFQWDNIEQFLTGLDSRQAEFDFMERLNAGPRGVLRQQAKLNLPSSDEVIIRQEEAFQGRWGKLVPGVAISSRMYTMILNKLRADLFDQMVDNLGRNGQVTMDEAKVIANFVNVATGRSDLNKIATNGNSYAATLNAVFFAPRYVASRFQYLAMPFYLPFQGGIKNNWRVKRAILNEYARTVGGLATVLGGIALLSWLLWDDDDEDKPRIEIDPRSTDFLKVRIGDTRVDFLAGLSQVFVLSSRLTMGSLGYGAIKSSVSGKVRKFNEGYDPQNQATLLAHFARTKMAPIPGAITTYANNMENVVGQKETPLSMAQSLLFPMSFGEVGKTMEARGIPLGTALSVLGLLGVGLNTYGPKTTYAAGTPEERTKQIEKDLKNLQWDDKDQPAYSEFLTPAQLRQFHQRHREKRGLVMFNATYHGNGEDELKTRDKNRDYLKQMKAEGVSLADARGLLRDYYTRKDSRGVRGQLTDEYRTRLTYLTRVYGQLDSGSEQNIPQRYIKK